MITTTMQRRMRRGLGALLLAAACGGAAAADALPAFGADRMKTTVSGLSAGGFMAVQLQVAYSASIAGAGVVAGGPYQCADGNVWFTGVCMGRVPFFAPGASRSVGFARAFAASGEIDPLARLATRRVYVFSGTADSVVRQAAVDATAAFFARLGVTGERLAYVKDVPAGHALITTAAGNDCAANAAPYISHCDVGGRGYDQAGALLKHLLPALRAPVAPPDGSLRPFDQRRFAAAGTGMAEVGYLYVPLRCERAGVRCTVHVALHGCEQAADRASATVPQARFIADAGYNAWADANGLLVLYPQIASAGLTANPLGCWDWWGYTGANYARRGAPQMKAIMAMVGRLAEPR